VALLVISASMLGLGRLIAITSCCLFISKYR